MATNLATDSHLSVELNNPSVAILARGTRPHTLRVSAVTNQILAKKRGYLS
jgi:hypothetical protein